MKRLMVGAMGLLALGSAALAVLETARADDGAEDGAVPRAEGRLPVLTSGNAEVTRVIGPGGKEGFLVRLPAVNSENPVAEATILRDGEVTTFRTQLVSPDGRSGFGKSAPRDLSCFGSNPGYCQCHSEASTGWGYFATSMELWTSWNWDYSTVWHTPGQNYDPDANPPLHFENINLSLSGVGSAYAFSDLHADLKDGYGWFEIQVWHYHMYHQIDAWGNCTAYHYYT